MPTITKDELFQTLDSLPESDHDEFMNFMQNQGYDVQDNTDEFLQPLKLTPSQMQAKVNAYGGIRQPTITESAIQGIKDYVSPEKLGSNLMQTGGQALDLIQKPIEAVGNLAKNTLGKAGEYVMSKTVTPAIQSVTQAPYQKRPEEEPGILRTAEYLPESMFPEATKQVAELGVGALIGKTPSMIKKGYTSVFNPTNEQIEKKILNYYQKGVRPTVVGNSTVGQLEQNQANQLQAVKSITKNKSNLSLKTPEGEVIKGETPKSLSQTMEAVDQTKTNIFKKYNDLAEKAGETGVSVDLNNIADELESSILDDKVMKAISPDIFKYVKKRVNGLRSAGSFTPEETQRAIKISNESLKSFYKNPTYESASKASVDAMIANKMRQNLDATIESTVGEGYQALKNEYGALKSIEKDVIHRAIVDGRKNVKGLLDFSDIASGAELVQGLITMNPTYFASSAAMKAIAKYYKYLNDPNTSIKKMFGLANRLKEL